MSEKNDKEQPIIVVRKIIKKSAHHGGSWKIAYADFVTAMMAFFLLMWLLSMLNKFQLMGIANYFNKPLKNVFVDNQKNDINQKKIPDEQTKKYKLQLSNKIPVKSDATAFGENKENGKLQDKKHSKQSNNSSAGVINQAQPQSGKQSKDGTKTKNQNNAKVNSKVNTENEKKYDSKEHEEDKSLSKLEELKKRLEMELKSNTKIKQYSSQLNFQIIADGLRISLHDLEHKPMFSLGKVDFEAYAKPLLNWLADKINETDRRVSIIGHTDSNPYPSLNYTNWELSADRANATRRVLVKYGMKLNKVLRVQGAADSVLKDSLYGEDPINRRIEIILLTDDAVNRMLEK